MHYATWTEALATGYPEVDKQHRELYELVNDLNADRLSAAPEEHIESALDRVARYVLEHFATEERLMAESAYPDAEAHTAVHREFTLRVAMLMAERRRTGGLTLPELAEVMATWLDNHIETWDKPLIAHLKSRV